MQRYEIKIFNEVLGCVYWVVIKGNFEKAKKHAEGVMKVNHGERFEIKPVSAPSMEQMSLEQLENELSDCRWAERLTDQTDDYQVWQRETGINAARRAKVEKEIELRKGI